MVSDLLDFPQAQSQETSVKRLQYALQDIAINVQIASNFCIRHPNYKPLELPVEMVDRFKMMPADVQNKYLSLQLRSFIYGIYYNGSMRTALALDADSSALQLHQDLENNFFLGVDLEFYKQLHNSNSGEGYFDPGWCMVKQEINGSLAVTKGGLTLHIDRDRHLQPTEQFAAVGDLVAIRLPKNRVQNGFYMAVANAGPQSLADSVARSQTVRIYFNLSPEGAVAVMGTITQHLNQIGIPFTFKALYNPGDYGRYDSAVLYFEKRHYEAIRSILRTVYVEDSSYFYPEVPLFTKLLLPGLGLAEEPDQKFATQESFGMNRCQIVANGLLQVSQAGKESSQERLKAILENFSLLGIELQRSYLNSNSEDIYTL